MLSIVIAVYNEQHRLPRTLERWTSYLDSHYGKPYEFLIVDDGSVDGTVAAVEAFARQVPKVKLLKLSPNAGRGAAIRAGVLASKGDLILATDADGSVDPEAVPRFAKLLEEDASLAVLIASRNLPGSQILTKQPVLRVALGHVFLLMARVLFAWNIADYTLGFKLFRREAAHDVFSRQLETGFVAEAELVVVALRRGWGLRELPVLWTDYKDSRVRAFRDSWRSFLGLARIVARDRAGRYR